MVEIVNLEREKLIRILSAYFLSGVKNVALQETLSIQLKKTLRQKSTKLLRDLIILLSSEEESPREYSDTLRPRE